jgi:hypothetical protein
LARLGHQRGRYDELPTPVERIDHPDLHMETWRITVEFGWTKTYDAEYVALARILDCQLVTLDMRLHRGTKRLGFVITPDELIQPKPTPPSPGEKPPVPPE